MTNSFKASTFGRYINDVWIAKTAIGYGVVIGVVYSFLYIYFMSIFAE